MFFKRKEQNLIPPVSTNVNNSGSGNKSPSRSPYHSNASTYVASRDGDPYSTPSSKSASSYPPAEDDYLPRDKYSRSNGVGDIYSRGGAELDNDRNELFSGYNAQKSGSGRFFDGPPSGNEPAPGEENDEDVEGIKQQTRFVKQDSVNSTRNALRLAREAEDTARNTLMKLGDQSEKLANTERHLDVAKGHSSRADDNTNELKQLNRSIFRPVITFNKDAKRAAQEAKIQARYEDERLEREKTMMDIRESQNRLGRAATYGRNDDEEGLVGGSGRSRFKTAEQLADRKEQRKRYQFEATASDDELEDELDNNLDEIGDMSKRLKALGMAMGQELDNQNHRIDTIEGKAIRTEEKIHMNTQRLKKIK
ncbi:Protein transport protein sec9 [Hypsizygus marmoreus]|uniref:Protein transport protein sec9 n=1 Tax=Hypsizygus marmoreus TaxID=39966 RepID=A0A369K801_HYPMA|nr:Protein transport protein sec9 [Hypsizygus marmoreus]